MSKHRFTRRTFMQASLVSSSTFVFNPTFVFAKAKESAPYQPTYFTEEEWKFVNAMVDQLIPEDELGGGAIAADVPKFIDLEMNRPYGKGELWYMDGPFAPDSVSTLGYQDQYSPRDLYRHAITDINQYLQKQYQKKFHELDGSTQIEVMTRLENGKIPITNLSSSATFFNMIWQNTQEGFLADPQYGGNKEMIGWKLVGFPGARADFMDWVDQPNVKYPYPPISLSGKR